ncbi:MAG: 6-phosphofructokinase [Proteobacteria bacterium]|nr:6-phosphofructokinase [Candidatus Enterousia scatequi]
MKKIGIITTGGDCSGLNAVINSAATGVWKRGWRIYGILDGTDGLAASKPHIVEITPDTMPPETARLAGSVLRNGRPDATNFISAEKNGHLAQFNKSIKKSLHELNLDALILVGGNGSLSLAWTTREIYSDLQLICIPKTIDMDIPLTDKTIGFDTAVQQLTSFCDQLMMTARSHHRWFVVQSMGRECGQLALHAGIASGATAILMPEIKFNTSDLIKHIQKSKTDYGVILVSEGIKMRGHSGRPADMISRELDKAGISNRTAYPEHTQRTGDTTACDRILAARFADCALHAIENNETYVMTALQDNICKTISLDDVINAGHPMPDPNIHGLVISNACVEPDNKMLHIAQEMGIYIGKTK